MEFLMVKEFCVLTDDDEKKNLVKFKLYRRYFNNKFSKKCRKITCLNLKNATLLDKIVFVKNAKFCGFNKIYFYHECFLLNENFQYKILEY